MAAISSALLSANTGAGDAPLQSQVANVFTGKRVFKSAPMQKELMRVGPENSAGYNATIRYKIDNAADYLGDVLLEWSTAAASSTSATGTHPRFVDWFGFALIETVTVRFTSQQLQIFQGRDLYMHYLLSVPTDQDYSDLVGGGLSAADRNANATSAYITYVPLSLLFWVADVGDYLPIGSEILRDQLLIEIKTESLNEVIETDGSDLSQTVTKGDLLCQVYQVSDQVQAEILAETMSTNPDSGINGYARQVSISNHQQETILANTSEQEFSVTGLNQPTSDLWFAVTNDSDVPDASTQNTGQDVFNFQQITTHTITGFSSDIDIAMPDRLARLWQKNTVHSGPAGSEFLYSRAFGIAPEASGQYGYLNLSGVSNRKLKVTMAAAAAGTLYLSAQCYNHYFVDRGGNLRMLYYVA